MKNCFLICTFIFVSLIFQISNAQDSIWLWKKIWIPVKIISLNRSTLDYVNWNDTTGVMIRRPVNEIRKIKYRSGEEINLNNWQKQASIGLSIFTFPPTLRYVDNGKYDDTEYRFKSYGFLLSYCYRGHNAGLVLGAGYAHTAFSYTSHEFSTIYPNSSYERSSDYESDNFVMQFTPRIYLNIRNVSPFFDLGMGLEFYSSTEAASITSGVATMIEPGFGLQVRLFRNWLVEMKAGLCTRSDYKKTDGILFIPDFKFSFYRILYSHISRI